MAKSGPGPIVFILLFLGLVGGGWFFVLNKPASQDANNTPTPTPAGSASPRTIAPAGRAAPPVAAPSFALPASVPAGTAVRIDGSTSMVTINQNFKNGFQGKFSGTTVDTKANGSEKGIQDLAAPTADIAAISPPLTAQEQGQGLAAVPAALDKIALVVGINKPFKGGLTSAQVQEDIFKGNAQDWSKVGGPADPIKVINRLEVSGTHQTFKEQVLSGANFGTGLNITKLDRDATTLRLEALGHTVAFAIVDQAVQKTVPGPPTVRRLMVRPILAFGWYYAYKNPPSQIVKDFLGYGTSPKGQKAMPKN